MVECFLLVYVHAASNQFVYNGNFTLQGCTCFFFQLLSLLSLKAVLAVLQPAYDTRAFIRGHRSYNHYFCSFFVLFFCLPVSVCITFAASVCGLLLFGPSRPKKSKDDCIVRSVASVRAIGWVGLRGKGSVDFCLSTL